MAGVSSSQWIACSAKGKVLQWPAVQPVISLHEYQRGSIRPQTALGGLLGGMMPDDPMYHDGMRRLQDMRETRPLADRLEQVTVRAAFTEEDRAFIERCPMFFIATADADGHPDCSYKGGLPGFVRVLDGCTLAIPDYDGNGMYRSWGNVLVNPHIGLLFLDFENPKRIRVNGTAQVSENDPLRIEYPGSVFIIRVTATRIFPNCPRYIHKMQLVEHSVYAPRSEYTPPVPAWKTFDVFRDSLPARDHPDGKKE